MSICRCNHEGEGGQVRIIFEDYSTTEIGHERAWDNTGYPGEAVITMPLWSILTLGKQISYIYLTPQHAISSEKSQTWCQMNPLDIPALPM